MLGIKQQIEAFLRKTGMPPATFGRWAAGDPRLVLDMRQGRTFRPATETKIKSFMTEWGDKPHKRSASYNPTPRRPGARHPAIGA